jgi:hypothetical protein
LARTLLADLVERGLDPEQAILFVIDGSKALRRAITDVFGEHALVHRCHRHKERNVCHLEPERDRDQVRARMRTAWSLTDPDLARQRLELLAGELDRSWPDAARSLREGLDATLTLMRLEISGQLAKTLCSTNPCESMIEIVRPTQRNVKRRRHAQALDRRRHARRRAAVPAHHRLPRSRQARHRDRAARPARCRAEPRPEGGRRARYYLIVKRGSPPNFHDDPDILRDSGADAKLSIAVLMNNGVEAFGDQEPHVVPFRPGPCLTVVLGHGEHPHQVTGSGSSRERITG